MVLDSRLIQQIVENGLLKELIGGKFGLEKENVRVDENGRIALTPHPKAFGSKVRNPFIKTDFSESQIEMVTPAFDSIEETYQFLETLQDIVILELKDEYLWPSSNPPALPDDAEIAIAAMEDPTEEQYRYQLAEKYGRKKQLLSGIHYNFSFNESFLQKLYVVSKSEKRFRDFKDSLYLKTVRNLLKHRWLLIYLTGASPVFDKSYLKQCVEKGKRLDDDSCYIPNMNSLRNSECGYRNQKPFYVSFDSIEEYVRDLHVLLDAKELLSAKEFYSPVRIKPVKGKDSLQSLLDHGIAYLELRMIDLNPLFKNGISKETMHMIHLFILCMLLLEDEPYGEKEQQRAALYHDHLAQKGIEEELDMSFRTLQEEGLKLIDEMETMLRLFGADGERFSEILQQEKLKLLNPRLTFAEQIKADIRQSSYLDYHLEKAKRYAAESARNGYQFFGYEDLELSTQLLLKAAIKRGIEFEILDRVENFIALKSGNQIEYVKQATKTSLDSYITFLIMENKIVTKEVLKRKGIRVPDGKAYHRLADALADFELYQNKQIVIKPKSTNFGLGITIFTVDFSKEDYQKAFEMAFAHDQTVLLEEFMTGKEYRFLVMGDEVVGILHRVPANVVGDGEHTIEELVIEKNKDPLRGKGYKTPLEIIRLDEVEEMFLKNQSKKFSDVPNKGEIVYLRENSNISTGGDSIDYTDDIPDSYKNLAVQAAKAAGAVFCGVDMMIDDFSEEASADNYSIIEINFNPAIHIHCYPYKGKNRKADDKILDLLFGEIK
ncbi:bifunctional glutamate--cysteine ligase GshA/glutathione synthetase GshB [Bacillota bacterium Lsc_1132]